MQKLTDEQLARQVDDLDHLPWPVWEDALDKLLPVISRLLHGRLVEDENHRKHLVGGYTKFGAHSEHELGAEALYHYQGIVVEKLYDGSWEWKPEHTLAEQLEIIANSVIPKAAEKYANQIERELSLGYNRNYVNFDVEWLGNNNDDDDSAGDAGDSEENTAFGGNTDIKHDRWERICAAADDDPQLAQYVQIVGESKQLKDVREKGGYEPGDTDKLIKRLRRKVNKLK